MTYQYKEKGNNYRAMVLDLARFYQNDVRSNRPYLINDVTIAIHEGGLDTDTSRFTVDFEINALSFIDMDTGGSILTAWVHQKDLAEELFAGAGVDLDDAEEIFHDKIVGVVEALGEYHPVARAIMRLTADKKTEVKVRDFSEVLIFTASRENEQSVSVAFFKG